MRKRLVAIYSVLIVAIVLLAVFVPSCVPAEEKGTIWVKATFCDVPWEGAVNYTVTPASGSPIDGTSVFDTFSVTSGTWTCGNVSGGPDGAYLDSITPSATQTVSENGTITFTLNFEEEQDASIEFVSWTINGQKVTPNTPQTPYEVMGYYNIIDVEYTQHVAGCQGYEVAVNETSELSIHYTDGVQPVYVYVVNDACAVAKEPEPVEKVSQVPSFNGEPVQPGEEFELPLCHPKILDVETVWQLVKGINYTKTINWLGISDIQGECECILFNLLVPSFPMEWDSFTLVSSASVELMDDKDVNPDNNYAESPPLYLTVSLL
jgi:hypothetical protein